MLLASHSIINSTGIQITLLTFNLYFINKPILFATSSTKWKVLRGSVQTVWLNVQRGGIQKSHSSETAVKNVLMERQEQIEAINYVSINEHLKNQLSLSWFYIIIKKTRLRLQNAAARLLINGRRDRSALFSPLFSFTIDLKIWLITFKALHGWAPSCFPLSLRSSGWVPAQD